ncbi:MAG: T9SS type A sorting domain-containing protein [Flavobacteriales bacterium]|nr:T9SS type A sorting domain-containing protein [Flavobacteriales bacterium]
MKSTFAFLFVLFGLNAFAQPNFNLTIEEVTLLNGPGLQSFVVGQHDGKWLLIGGRTDGLHQRQPFASFLASDNNTTAYVVDPVSLQVWSASLSTLPTALNEQLQSTNMEFVQRDTVLYIVGGYGYSATAADHTTYPYLTAVNVPSTISAIINGTAIEGHFRYTTNNNLAVTGGYMHLLNGTFYLVGGQFFEGRYNPMGPSHGPGFTQVYSEAIKTFDVTDNGSSLTISNYNETTDAANLHRRDYNMVPQVFPNGDYGFTAFSGVFRPDVDLPWHNSVDITASGHTVNNTFDQLLSQYHSAHLPIYDQAANEMHTLFFGGMARYYYDGNGTLIDDENVPFVKTISLVTRDENGGMIEQNLSLQMGAFLGSGAEFIPVENVDYLNSEVLNLNSLSNNQPTLVGYIYGGIESSAENIFFINDGTQSWASNRLFKVYIQPDASTGIATRAVHGDDVLNLQVFPNPADDSATACLFSKYLTSGKIEVFNFAGQLVRTIEVKEIFNKATHFAIDLTGLDAGTYHVRFSNGSFSTGKSIIVQ